MNKICFMYMSHVLTLLQPAQSYSQYSAPNDNFLLRYLHKFLDRKKFSNDSEPEVDICARFQALKKSVIF